MAVRDLGIVTAYGYAKAGGYTGTEQEFTALLGDLALTVEDLENMTVSVTTLEPNQQATASYADGVLSLGIPQGRNGEVTQDDLDAQLENYATNEALLDAFIVKSASGDIASFSDGADDVPMKSVKVAIVPKQSGSGDPSPTNVRPITGWTDADVNVVGANLLDDSNATLNAVSRNGEMFTNTSTDSRPYFNLIVQYFNGGTYIGASTALQITTAGRYSLPLTIPNGTTAFRIKHSGSQRDFYVACNFSHTGEFILSLTVTSADPTVVGGLVFGNLQIETGTTATEYVPYTGHTTPVPLGQTVYGGEVNPISGELKITHAMVDMGTLGWRKTPSLGRDYFYVTLPNGSMLVNSTITGNGNAVCEVFKIVKKAYTTITDNEALVGVNFVDNVTPSMVVYSSAYTDVNAFKTMLNGKHIVYELATPTTVQLTPAQVASLLGTNNVWADCGAVEVEYRADPTLAYAEISPSVASVIAPVEETNIATRNYTTGSLLIMNNMLYKVTANIANGGTITPNTNVTATTLSEVISAL